MDLFSCSKCQQTVFFENVRCTFCGSTLAYLPDRRVMTSIEPVPENESSKPEVEGTVLFQALAKNLKGARYRLCANSIDYDVCNWAVAKDDPNPYCEACRLNEVIPKLSEKGNIGAWRRLEIAKRRLFYTLFELGLPVESRTERPENGLVFQFKEDLNGVKVFTGHNDGVITVNVAEADDPFREKLRKDMGEGYRTVLGHFRHEIGHYYWDRLIKDTKWVAAYRALFGDEQVDYDESLKRHYAQGAPADWPERFVSEYATMHPWEDWAETWAHYLHMVDTLGTARSYGLVLAPRPITGGERKTLTTRSIDFDDFDALLKGWLPISVALNSLNRSMGLNDPYPFVLMPRVVEKLRFVHDVVEHWNAEETELDDVVAHWAKLSPPAVGPEAPSADQPHVKEPLPQQPAATSSAATGRAQAAPAANGAANQGSGAEKAASSEPSRDKLPFVDTQPT
jgi:hypothetical protein